MQPARKISKVGHLFVFRNVSFFGYPFRSARRQTWHLSANKKARIEVRALPQASLPRGNILLRLAASLTAPAYLDVFCKRTPPFIASSIGLHDG